jgi:periplasmic protein TonB
MAGFMTTTILNQAHTGLGIGFAPPERAPKEYKFPQRPPLGNSGAEARFELLPDQKLRAGAMSASITVQICLVTFFILLPMFFPDKLIPKFNFNVMNITAPLTEVPLPPKAPVIRPKPQPVVVETPKVFPTAQPKIIAPRVVAPKVPKVEKPTEALKLNTFEAPKRDASLVAPSAPKKPVETGSFNPGSSAPATITKPTPVEKVQTGGFGDPNGLPGPGDPNKRANINHVGSFDLPGGPGYGNGTGGANGLRGTVQSTGFGNGTAIPPAGNGGNHGSIQTGGFSTAAVDSEKPRAREQEQQAAVQPVEILDKPKPEYTAEARTQKIEGDVVLQVVFKATGQIEVLGVKKGLGHGLDESAERAAQKIRYKPAISNGQPVDFPATVHIVFQLAY